uniref:Uncharacterized protein n=1 Tax=Candidatus Kentrum sp. TUN TaxID=2126343 RepID=A0A450ZHP3_9GAMM|nr:MAG: hypothetical protein BECKTUN1418F_GA0071002_101310 [Candidatus Kentron sp. TUN]VFK53343.1 MAG: hypothetical protein BECKTUN1418E_GA0071001_101510 [Candidatus Kentron sp. TUN]
MPDSTNPPGFIDTFLDEMGQCIRESTKDVIEEKTEDLIEGIAEKEFKPSLRFFDALGNYNRALDKSENAGENIDAFERALFQFLFYRKSSIRVLIISPKVWNTLSGRSRTFSRDQRINWKTTLRKSRNVWKENGNRKPSQGSWRKWGE